MTGQENDRPPNREASLPPQTYSRNHLVPTHAHGVAASFPYRGNRRMRRLHVAPQTRLKPANGVGEGKRTADVLLFFSIIWGVKTVA